LIVVFTAFTIAATAAVGGVSIATIAVAIAIAAPAAITVAITVTAAAIITATVAVTDINYCSSKILRTFCASRNL
jgi:hypothetical protein